MSLSVLLRRALVLASLCAATGAAAADTAADKTSAARAALFPELDRSGYIAEGATNPKSVLYVFFDANCWYCNLTWRAVQPYEKAGLQVRWIPVAYQKESSFGRAAAMLAARDPAAALRANETGYRANSYDGGLPPLAKVSSEVRARLQANTNLMKKFGAQGTPAVVWKESTGAIGFINGVPRLSELPRITGLPVQKIDDPELVQFR